MASILNTGFNTTNKKFSLVKIEVGDILEFPFFPSSYSEDRAAALLDKKMLQRNFSNYEHTGGATSVNMSVAVVSEKVGGDDVYKRYLWLLSCTFSDKDAPPPVLGITWNESFIGRRFVLSSVQIQTSTLWKGSSNFKEATFALSFFEVSQRNVFYSDIINRL